MCENGDCKSSNQEFIFHNKGDPLAQPNFQFEKRQKELARKKKQEEKKQRKLEERNPQPNDNPVPPSDEGVAS
jgi:hypothetical protein